VNTDMILYRLGIRGTPPAGAAAPVAGAPAVAAQPGATQATPAQGAAAATTAAATAEGQGSQGIETAQIPTSELAERRGRLAREFAELQWDLGGLAYEMASRDHFRVDLLVRKAAELQRVDAELAELQRVLKLTDAGAAGSCPTCGALYARGAMYCWQCGTQLMESSPVGAVAQT
jgi:hypothetical protein